MKIVILSDIHDNIWNLKKVLKELKSEKVDAIIFCGDFCAPFTFKKLAEVGIPTYAVFGNVDGAQQEITHLVFKNHKHITLKKELLEVELGGRKIAICHNNQFAESLALIGKYDVVFHGHTHHPRVEKIGKTILANPGEVHGGVKGKCTFGIYDTEKNEIEIREIE